MPHPDFLDSANPAIYTLRTTAPGPSGRLSLTARRLRAAPSGEIFGLTQNAGMGWDPRKLSGREFLILSTQGGIRAPDGSPVLMRVGLHCGPIVGGIVGGNMIRYHLFGSTLDAVAQVRGRH